jgi:hypothetical protein
MAVLIDNPGLSLALQPWVRSKKNSFNPERVYSGANPFRVGWLVLIDNPGLSLALQPWAEIGQRLRRKEAFGKEAFGKEAFGKEAFGKEAFGVRTKTLHGASSCTGKSF